MNESHPTTPVASNERSIDKLARRMIESIRRVQFIEGSEVWGPELWWSDTHEGIIDARR